MQWGVYNVAVQAFCPSHPKPVSRDAGEELGTLQVCTVPCGLYKSCPECPSKKNIRGQRWELGFNYQQTTLIRRQTSQDPVSELSTCLACNGYLIHSFAPLLFQTERLCGCFAVAKARCSCTSRCCRAALRGAAPLLPLRLTSHSQAPAAGEVRAAKGSQSSAHHGCSTPSQGNCLLWHSHNSFSAL